MLKEEVTILIPALKKSVAFQDDLVKKLFGISLVQRSINRALLLVENLSNIHLLTDSDEIALIGSRNGVKVFCNQTLTWTDQFESKNLSHYLQLLADRNMFTLIISPYAPLVETQTIGDALNALIKSEMDILKPVKLVNRRIFDHNGKSKLQVLFDDQKEIHRIESKAFTLTKSKTFQNKTDQNQSVFFWPVQNELFEIESYQDWWVCEKLLQRKRIIFRIIGNKKVGTGHIYRALSIAHEITDHEILFVTDYDNSEVVNKLAGYDYWLASYHKDNIVDAILDLKPDLVINDILSTMVKDVVPLKKNDIKVVNFEDVGSGAKYADLTINELYEKPFLKGENFLWGCKYFFVRDEFNSAKQHRFKKKVDTILLTFGGTDQNNLTAKIFHLIKDICFKNEIVIHIVTGAGYDNYNELKSEVESQNNVTLTRGTGVISSIMEKAQIAIVSNGRTVYELSHMNIPSIVISQHKREETHNFACKANGFIPLGEFKEGHTESLLIDSFEKLAFDSKFRKKLFERAKQHNFSPNKKRVINKLISLFE